MDAAEAHRHCRSCDHVFSSPLFVSIYAVSLIVWALLVSIPSVSPCVRQNRRCFQRQRCHRSRRLQTRQRLRRRSSRRFRRRERFRLCRASRRRRVVPSEDRAVHCRMASQLVRLRKSRVVRGERRYSRRNQPVLVLAVASRHATLRAGGARPHADRTGAQQECARHSNSAQCRYRR